MALRCVTCGAGNPATNRFCGQCGRRLDEANDLATDAATDAGSGAAIDDAPANSEATQPPDKFQFIVDGEGGSSARTGVNGPSFLGLSDDSTLGYEDEERRPPSHLRRNIAVSVLAIAVVLTLLQWRSIRDNNLRRHRLAAGASGEAVPGNAAAANPSAVAADSSLPPADADHASPLQSAGNSLESAPPAATSNPSADGTGPHAMGAPVADVAESQLPALSHQAAEPHSYRSAHREASLSRTARGHEMDRAAKPSDERDHAAQLWKEVGKGNSQAQVELARMYVQGSGVVRNCEQAEVLLRGAAKKGNEQAKLSLQEIHVQGGCSSR